MKCKKCKVVLVLGLIGVGLYYLTRSRPAHAESSATNQRVPARQDQVAPPRKVPKGDVAGVVTIGDVRVVSQAEADRTQRAYLHSSPDTGSASRVAPGIWQEQLD